MRSKIIFWVFALLLGVLYVFATLFAVGNFIGVSSFAAGIGVKVTPIGVLTLSVLSATPAIILGFAILFSRGASRGKRLLYLFAGVAVLAVLQLNTTHFLGISSLIG